MISTLAPRSPRTLVATDSAGEFAVLLRASYGELRRVCRELLATPTANPVAPSTLVSATALRMLGGSGAQDLGRRGCYFSRLAGALRKEFRRSGRTGARKIEITDLGLPAVAAEQLAEALDRLEQVSPRHSQVATLRLLGGLNLREVADELSIPRAEVENVWQSAREFLTGFLQVA